MEDIFALGKVLSAFPDWKITFDNYYLTRDHTTFSKVVEIVIRPDLKKVKVRLGLEDTDIDNL